MKSPKPAKTGTKAKGRGGVNKPMQRAKVPNKPVKTKYAEPTQKQKL